MTSVAPVSDNAPQTGFAADLIIRPATADDYEAVTRLLAELGRPLPTPENEEAIRTTFTQHVNDPGSGTLVAERAGTILGVLVLHFRARLNYATEEAWIPDFVVTERERGQGVATKLFAAAVAAAKGRGCHQLTLESSYFRTRAHRFYEREGMSDVGKFFVMKLGEG